MAWPLLIVVAVLVILRSIAFQGRIFNNTDILCLSTIKLRI